MITDNVCYDADGNLVLIANGDYYEGDKKGINASYSSVRGGKRTGAAVKSRRAYGYGSFEVEMTVPAFNGICTSIWLYNNFPDETAGRENHNYEIDIELHGTAVKENGALRNDGNLSSMACTTWLTEKDYKSQYVAAGKPLNDGAFHKFRFDWHSDKVEFYLDGRLMHTTRQYIPDNEMYFNIGCWFPNNWCGEPNFETDYLTVKSFSYKPFSEKANSLHADPQAGNGTINAAVTVPGGNYFANGSLEYDVGKNEAFTVTGTHEWSKGKLSFDGSLSQTIDIDSAGLSYLLELEMTAGAEVSVAYQTFVGGVKTLKTETVSDGAVLSPPEGTTRMVFTFTGKAKLQSVRLTLAK